MRYDDDDDDFIIVILKFLIKKFTSAVKILRAKIMK